eukprot:scaffold117377_cov27-Tisochrysis_lutea.AAC.1
MESIPGRATSHTCAPMQPATLHVKRSAVRSITCARSRRSSTKTAARSTKHERICVGEGDRGGRGGDG